MTKAILGKEEYLLTQLPNSWWKRRSTCIGYCRGHVHVSSDSQLLLPPGSRIIDLAVDPAMATTPKDPEPARLPQELIDAVISAIYESSDEDPVGRLRALRACALAHRSLLHRCQRYLFKDIRDIPP